MVAGNPTALRILTPPTVGNQKQRNARNQQFHCIPFVKLQGKETSPLTVHVVVQRNIRFLGTRFFSLDTLVKLLSFFSMSLATRSPEWLPLDNETGEASLDEFLPHLSSDGNLSKSLYE